MLNEDLLIAAIVFGPIALLVGVAIYSGLSTRRVRNDKDKAAQVIAETLTDPRFLYLRSFRSDQPTTEQAAPAACFSPDGARA